MDLAKQRRSSAEQGIAPGGELSAGCLLQWQRLRQRQRQWQWQWQIRWVSCLLLGWALGLGLMAAAHASQRNFYFERLSEIQGLPRDNVTAFAQDKHGFIWIGTQAGLSRFDGYRLVNYRHVEGKPGSLGEDWVQALLLDPQGQLWVGTRRGLQRYRPELDDFETLSLPAGPGSGQGHLQVNAICADAKGNLWVGTESGLYQYQTQIQKFQVHTAGLSHPRVLSLSVDESGQLWIGTESGVDHWSPGAQTLSAVKVTASQMAFAMAPAKIVLVDAQNLLWVASEIGVQAWRLDEKGQVGSRVFAVPRSRSDAYVALLQDRQKQLWMGMETEGLWRWQPKEQRFEVLAHREADAHSAPKHITSLFHDRFGSLWVGTWASGAYRADLGSGGFNKYVHVPGDANSLVENRIFSITSDGQRGLWLATYDAAIRLNPRSGHAQTFRFGSNEKESLNFSDTHVSWQDKVAWDWVLKHMDPKTSQVKLPSFSADNPLAEVIRYISSDPQGQLWLGSRGGLHRLDPSSGKLRTFKHDAKDPGSLSQDYVRMLLVDKDGDVWAATYQGLDRLMPGSERFLHYRNQPADPNSLLSDRVQYLFQDSKQRIWVGTAQGLTELIKRRDGSVQFRRLPGSTGLSSDPIGGILEDAQGRLWVSTTAGISRLDPESDQIQNYTAQDGMIEGFYFANSAFKDSDGRMYFGGLNGLTGFHPDDIRENAIPPQLALTAIRVNNDPLLPGQRVQGLTLPTALAELRSLTLGSSHETLSLEFAALHYADPQRNRYAYKLEGYDKDWVSVGAGQRIASYTNLSPGNYVFQLKGANKDGLWSEESIRLELKVQPAYWATWWFRLFSALALLGLLWAMIHARLAALTRQKLQLEAQVSARTAELSQEKRRVEDTMALLVDEKREVERQKEIVEQAHGNISTLSEMGRRITATLDQDLILRSIHGYVAQLMPSDGFALGLLDPVSRSLDFPYLFEGEHSRSGWRLSQAHGAGAGAGAGAGSVESSAGDWEWACLAQAKALHCKSSEHSALQVFGVDCAEALLAPLLINGQLRGLIGVYSRQPGVYQAWHLDMLVTLAAYSAIALENANTFARLRQTQEELVQQQKFAALGSLVAGVAHELNTPLGNCLLAASTLEQNSSAFAARLSEPASGLRRSELKDFVDGVTHSAQLLMRGLSRSADLVRSFKEVAVDRSSQLRRRFALQALVEDVLETLANELKNKGHDWQIDIASDLEMDSYPGPLGQVLSNLVKNSILHGFEARRGGRIRISASLLKDAEGIDVPRLRILYSDDGRGIAAEHIERVFDPFFTTKMGQGGSGLGLSISYNLIHSVLGGDISVRSQPGQGVEFELDLPLSAPQAQAPSSDET
ncbi:two-component regulator propeller domain-containing protein [Paucibacter sp. AS339]|uniref:two-component regulator propeller domain-containing protein n=1 Tax=Paucibacter hankyongi TaxID=3133434 RepID=UPI0030B53A83